LDLDLLFNPRTVALIGASKDIKKSGGDFLKRMLERGYKGTIYPINLRETEILGVKTYPNVQSVPGQIDLAIFCIPVALVIKTMEECIAKGIKYVVVHTSGFNEVGNPVLEAELVHLARTGGSNVENEDVAFIGQSGTLCDSYISHGQERGLKINKAVSLGNEADLKFTDYLSYFAADPRIKIISAYIEGVREGKKFLDLVQKINRRKPVLVWKAGRTSAGTRATLSHTGSIAGSHQINEAAFRQAGIITANSLESLVDLTAGLYAPFLPKGRKVGILVDTGGGAVAAADACESAGLEVARLSTKVQEELRKGFQGKLPPFAGITNPVDLVSPKDEDRINLYDFSLELMAPEVDYFMILSFHELSDPNFMALLEKARDRLKKPIFMVPPIPIRKIEQIKNYTRRGIPSFYNVDRAALTIHRLIDYARWLESR
ncbi:MAG: CoA-binding protein, partial [Dehalococcoidia bacterium]|nr:CoA-binding protein [Dehalococcoidia bacterium]